MTASSATATHAAGRQWIALIVTFAMAVFAAWVDWHNDEVQAPLMVVIVGGVAAGMIEPRRAWRWALILGFSIIVGETVGLKLGMTPPWPEQTGTNFGALVALIPAFIATYLGVGARRLVTG